MELLAGVIHNVESKLLYNVSIQLKSSIQESKQLNVLSLHAFWVEDKCY